MSAELLGQVREFLRFQGELKLRGIPRVEGDGRQAMADGRVPIADGRQPIADSRLPIADNRLPFAEPQPPIAASAKAASLEAIRAEIGDCTRCKLCKGRKNIVFGVGNPKARLMFVGEGPGRDEDIKGEPFVGAAGQLLNRMIIAMGLKREDVYIANVVKCRPPNNRDPEPDEVAACEPFLKAQIQSVKPEIIVGLGRYAVQTLLRDSTPVSRQRGKWREYEGTPLMPTYHPAYLLRNPAEKRPVWQDLQNVMQRLGSNTPQGQ